MSWGHARPCLGPEGAIFPTQVRKIFPDTSTRIIIQCSDGRKRALAALMALDDAGYSNIVGLKGGFNAWSLKFDNKLNRRMPIDGYKVCAVWHTTMRGTMAVLWS